MYYEEEMNEVSDFDQDIDARKALIEEAKTLMAKEDIAPNEVTNLQRRWKRIGYWESVYEDTLEEEFDAILDAYYAKRKAFFKKHQECKEAIIAKAKAMLAGNDLNTNQMNELMNEWKQVPSAGKDVDDALWETFNGIRKQFYDRKHENWENMQAQFASAEKAKRALIERAKELSDSEDFVKTSETYKELMNEWKACGSAGRQVEDELWDAFQAARKPFFDRRSAYYDELHAVQKERAEAKQALIEKAKAIVDSKNYSREHTNQMKEFGSVWKTIGNCGKAKEDALWESFRSVMDAYFEGLKEFNESKHANWVQRMHEIRARKLELIQNQKRQIQHMHEDMVGLLGQRAIDEMEERIADKEDFIAQLEGEVAEIDAQLAK